jgi:hypothetical protein
MMVRVDTPVWSLALRRRPEHLGGQEQLLTQALAELIREARVQMLGADPSGTAFRDSRGSAVSKAA